MIAERPEEIQPDEYSVNLAISEAIIKYRKSNLYEGNLNVNWHNSERGVIVTITPA